MCNIVEMMTGCDGDFELVGPLRHWPHLQAVFKARSQMRGDRCSSMLLPPDYESAGIYAFHVDKDCIYISHRFAKQTVMVPMAKAPPFDLSGTD